MLSVPPRWAETLVALLIPPAAREEILGDLHERYTSLARYASDATSTVPLIVASHMRRTTDASTVLMEAVLLYISYLCAALYEDVTMLSDEWALLRLAIPVAIALAVFRFADAYGTRGNPLALRQLRTVAVGVVVAFLLHTALSASNRDLALPPRIMLLGGGLSLPLVTAVRILFPPFDGRKLSK